MACWLRDVDRPWVCEGVGGLLGVGMSAGKDVGCLLDAGVLQGMGVGMCATAGIGVCWSLAAAGDLCESSMDVAGWR